MDIYNNNAEQNINQDIKQDIKKIEETGDVIWEDLFKPYWLHAIFFILICIITYYRVDRKKVYADFSNIYFVGLLLFIIAVSIWGLKGDNHRIRDATQRSIVAFIIAYCSHTNLFFVVYFLIWILSYNTFHWT